MTGNEKSALLLIIVALLAILMLAGCGRIDQLRGHNANMIEDCRTAVVEVIKEECPRLYAEHETLKRDLDDLKERNELARKDHPWKGAKIERATPEKPSPQDVNLFCAYSAVADGKDAKRKASEERWSWWHRLVWWVKAFLYAAPFIAILWLFLYFRKRFFQFGEVQVKHIQATVTDKEKRRAIAGGSPAEAIYKKIRDVLPWGRESGPQEPTTAPKSDDKVSVAKEGDKSA